MWSFVGVMVKSASLMVGSGVITFLRFFLGFVFLGAFLAVRSRKIKIYWKDKWIWAGVIGKTGNYIFENMAIAMGFAYGNIVVWPVQAVVLTFVSVMYLHEEIYFSKILAVALCVIGVVLVSWKGMSLSVFLGVNLIPTVFFIISAVGTCVHVLSQRKLIMTMNSGNMNISVFLICSVITAVPLPFTPVITGTFNPVSVFSLIGLGVITGASFYIYARVLKNIQFMVVTIISNTTVIFTLLWAVLFFHEKINSFVIAGVVILLFGLIIINIPKDKFRFTGRNKIKLIDKTDN
jgi:drug/metabolite transporter (DMT)-like permease